MVEKNEKEENINSLCKKYFTPELCDEPVTETKRALEFKLYAQFKRYGKKISREYSQLIKDSNGDEIEGFIYEAIAKCFSKWRKFPLKNDSAYSAYFGSAIDKIFIRENKNIGKTRETEISLEASQNGDEKEYSRKDNLEDSSEVSAEELISTEEEIKMRLRFIDKCFRAKKRADWWKGIVTGYLYEDLHIFFSHYPSEPIQRYSFIDVEIYNWENAPTQKQVAQFLGKDEGQVSRALTAFVENIEELYKKQGNVL